MILEAMFAEHEDLARCISYGDTTVDWLENLMAELIQHVPAQPSLLPMALVAGIAESRFLDRTKHLNYIVDLAVEKLCESYPGLKREDIVNAIPEVRAAYDTIAFKGKHASAHLH